MQVKNINVLELLNRLRLYFLENDITRRFVNEEPPLRAELFNVDQLEQHGKHLANKHKAIIKRAKERLLKRLANNEKILTEVRGLLTDSVRDKHLITPAGEWLLDNFYLIEDHIRTGKRHLPKGYSEGLPRLTNTASAGLPRVYDIALELITHTDGRIDIESLSSFIRAYQSVTHLKLGELWAIPIMLRLALIENLRRVSTRIAIDRINQNLAEYWATLMTETAEKDPKSLILVIADMARSDPPIESSFVAELIRQLMWKGPGLTLPLTWMEQRLSESHLTSIELVNMENQKQAADQVSISNSIGSLRFLGSVDWREFVETMSIVEHTLRDDPDGTYASMDFSSRDRYRHIVEKIAKYSSLSENEVAGVAIRLAKEEANGNAIDPRMAHVGYYLVGEGVIETERLARQKLPIRGRFLKAIKRYPLLFYAGVILLLSVVIAGYLLLEAYREGAGKWALVVTGIVALLGASHLATTLINWLATMIIKPDTLPRLDFSKGIPPEYKTMVIVPTMLINPEQAEELVDSLEVRFLANRDRNLYFGILTDFSDAATQTLPGDVPVLELAKNKIEELNRKYAGNHNKFYLFHRPRKWNPYDKIWMGYERKRGKLSELNKLLRGNPDHNFDLVIGDKDALPGVKYIITLDTDTQLPRDTGWKLVGAMAHPLNRPFYDNLKQRITKGYGILQPRVSVSLTVSGGSIYAKIHGNEPGIDPYTRLTSDVYQDLFEEGSFIGKGIYDIDAFEQAIYGRFPENRILSHDLLEGCYTRSGLLSDVQFYEEYPTHYNTDVKRRHRWIRGDWQIGYWSLPFVPDANRRLHKNTLSALSKWKIFDNLRRSLIPVALTILLLLGWTVLHACWFWTLTVLIIIMLPSVISSLWSLVRKAKEITLWQHTVASVSAMADSLAQDAFLFICLPYEAYYSLDAIVRTGWRMIVSHRKLLEWNPSSNHKHNNDQTVTAAYRVMWFSPFIAACTLVYVIIYAPIRLVVAAPVLILWAIAPLIAWWISRPFKKQEAKLSAGQIAFLRRIARKTWGFFENFVGPEDNWLPVDNYQVRPNNVIAHRTSPTNIGLSLLANLSAYDFGYITTGTLIKLTANTIGTLDNMERYEGHLYNWYDTISLKPLTPKYISTVDSGNLAGHLLTLKQGLLALPGEPIPTLRLLHGLLDTVGVIENELPGDPVIRDIRARIKAILDTPDSPIERIVSLSAELVQLCPGIASGVSVKPEDSWWIARLAQQSVSIHDELKYLFPWVLLSTPEKFVPIIHSLKVSTLSELLKTETELLSSLESFSGTDDSDIEKEWLDKMIKGLNNAIAYVNELTSSIEHLAAKCDEYANLNYEFLYDRSKHLLTIGYNVEEHERDTGYYDLLASEARLSSFIAIAQGKLPQEAWFALGRLLANVKGKPILLSWSGSMFEYLMPMLVMPSYENTLLDQTEKAAVVRQIEYGTERNVPWGISESGYNMFDAILNYQYKAFGVPGLGLKRGLSEDLVIAPYATALALMVAPGQACNNLKRMSLAGFEGIYGFFEAVDYTPSRLPRGQANVVIQSFMSHHQGMSFVSLAYALLGQPMQKRFEADLQFQATLLLLQERIPKVTSYYSHPTDISTGISVLGNVKIRAFDTPHTPVPEIQLLSNGRYHVMVTNAGGGYSRWKDIAVTRWREDSTCDNWGMFCYIRDIDDGTFWSNAYQPSLMPAKFYEATFTQGRAEFKRHDNHIETHTEIVVSPEDDIEMRRVYITNRSRRKRKIDVTTYAEVVLASPAADAMHPAFSNLFIETELVESRHAIICTRRPRSVDEHIPSMFHLVTVQSINEARVSYETDRAKFIGRGNTIAKPAAMIERGPLSNSQGAVLDPIISIRYELVLEPEEVVVIDMITGIGPDRDACIGLIDKYQDKHHKDRVFELAWTHSQVVLRQINATEADAQQYEQLAGSVVFNNPVLRAAPSTIVKNTRGQSGLWGYSVSGDLPIVLLEIENSANIELVKQLIQAHTYWRLKGLAVDLVIWNEDHGGYRQTLQNQILGLVAAGSGSELTDYPGGIFVRAADQISDEDRILFHTVARIYISDKTGTFEDHLTQANAVKNVIPYIDVDYLAPAASLFQPPAGLLFFNGTGGFSPDGKEYIIVTSRGKYTPAPWANILANPNFGAVISESGQSYTWINNAHECRITPWENDPVCDKSGEAFYLRDDDTGYCWSPMPLPDCGASPYITRHGFGYSVFEYTEDGISSEVVIYTDIAEPVKFFELRIKNNSGRIRHISATGFIDWVLGDLKSKTAMHVVTEADKESGALLAKNSYNTEFSGLVAFFDTDDPQYTFTADRTEFLGRNGTMKDPDAMRRAHLSGKAGAALDPCAAIQSRFVLADGQEHEVRFRLGAGKSVDDARSIIRKFKGPVAATEALQRVKRYWEHTLGGMQVETPDVALNLLTNGWLVYQTIACRLWARSGYYQSGGAFGFRDQLQDVLAVTHIQPSIARAQILLCASRQFKEGDVQHWWHPPTGRGVRTRCADDLLWLPFVVCEYIRKTGDAAILDEKVTFLEGRLLNAGEHSYYDLAVRSEEVANIYEHCVRAIKHASVFGTHGLPLIGSGDWNDGMDLVGKDGKGESVWLAFFMYSILIKFSAVAGAHGDNIFSEKCKNEAVQLQANIEKNGWDGEWYRRAYFDDGTPLGSSTNTECRIDSISQSWAVLSGAGGSDRVAIAIANADKNLVRDNAKLIQLLDPPFDKSDLDPGYIKGYVPGIRENGGQYTHAAVWLIMAHASLGNTDRAWELMNMINPIYHATDPKEVHTYKTEPYVSAADIYSTDQNMGRGGWTWYTGSAGWTYQLITEWMLGIKQEGSQLRFAPCLPKKWTSFKIMYRFRNTNYQIIIRQQENTTEKISVVLDGTNQPDDVAILVDDLKEHTIELIIAGNVATASE